MWTTGEVKQKGKWAFKKNYWKAVVVALLLSIFVGGGTVSFNFSDSFFSGFQDGFEEGMKDGTLQFVHPKYYADILISGILTLVEEKEAGDDEIKDIIIDLIERSGKD